MRPIRPLTIGCFTPVRERHLFLRTCILQICAQSLRPDAHAILINGPEADTYDTRYIDDLRDGRLMIRTDPRQLSTLLASTAAIKMLLERSIDLYFKIDSDDLYLSNYVESIVQYIFDAPLDPLNDSYCLNLTHQYWIDARFGGPAIIREIEFREGLGLSDDERAKGIVVGAPPTFVFNRRIAELLVSQVEADPSRHYPGDDYAWRHILYSHGVTITRVRTPRPVFGYLTHGGNTSRPQVGSKQNLS